MDIHDFERAIVGGPSLAEAASSFLRIKTAAKAVPPPDESGMLEGQFSVPVEKALSIMGELVKNEMETVYAYHVYAQSLRDLSHDSIAGHFDEHADDELDHADFLLKRMAVLGGPVHVPDLQAPAASSDPCEIVRTMVRMEQEGIAGWKKLLAVVGENPMKVTIEDYAAKEQEHLDDLWQLLPQEANRPVLQQKTAETLGQDDPGMGPESLDQFQQQMVGDQLLNRRNMGAISALSGAVPGALAGGLGAAHATPNPYLRAAGAAGGALLGALPGAAYGLSQQRAYENMNNPAMKIASAIKAMRKVAFDGDVNEWMAREQLLGQAQEQAESDYFKGQAQQAQAAAEQKGQEAQDLQQQLQQVQQQQQQMQQELDQSGQLQRQILDQARQVEQAASQSAASAHQTATASMLQSMQSQQEVMRHKGMTANMQQNVQAWKDQLMQIAQADPTSGAGAQVGMPDSGPIQPAPQIDPMTGQPMPAGQEGMAAMPEGAGEVPTQGAESNNGPAAEAPGAAGNPSAPTPTGAGAQAPAATEQQTPEQSLSPATKQGSVDWARFQKLARREPTKVAFPLSGRAIGAGLGALGGGALAYGTSRSGPDEGKMQRVQELEAEKARGEGSFGRALELVSKKMQLGVEEAMRDHPVAGTLGGAAFGATMGATAGEAASRMPKAYESLSKFYKK